MVWGGLGDQAYDTVTAFHQADSMLIWYAQITIKYMDIGTLKYVDVIIVAYVILAIIMSNALIM